MSLDRQIVRLMAAMILAIIAYVAPSAVQAHEGHAHHGHHAAAQPKIAQSAPKATAPSVYVAPEVVVRTVSPAWAKLALTPTRVEGARIEPGQDECCPVGCKTRCCGTMACCAIGVLSGPYTLAPTLVRTVTLIPRDVSGRAGAGPEALPKPPRSLA
ncbi:MULTISPECIES: hypothetical protein [Methylobacterium]|jgi:hypothetical protein|uniref:CopL family metal-binding regulatory protein n=2 Tax=Methylobacterium TaxID=407 RepID=A0A2U8VS67_9HYPH|nr:MULTISPECIES: hypothetical protein [Methylobacterium]AWN36629.1 hypothetical protein DK427_13525 [Methylobacterium radiodurans]GJD55026.1 hypothetical protein IFDJLNFL_0908 [Methylobacterium dankookense]VUF12024.1 hypothetical protein MTDSW087_01712 [Methylobacterium dankookense]